MRGAKTEDANLSHGSTDGTEQPKMILGFCDEHNIFLVQSRIQLKPPLVLLLCRRIPMVTSQRWETQQSHTWVPLEIHEAGQRRED